MTRTDIDIASFKKLLEAEKGRLETELSTLGVQDPNNPADWRAKVDDSETDSADPNEHADSLEEFDGRESIVEQLQLQYRDVLISLDRIEGGTYGICEISGEPIEVRRLEANPSARTCIAHINERLD